MQLLLAWGYMAQEKGLDIVHAIGTTVSPLPSHNHLGDFNQFHMLTIGAVTGMLQTAKEFVLGSYQKIQAKSRL